MEELFAVRKVLVKSQKIQLENQRQQEKKSDYFNKNLA